MTTYDLPSGRASVMLPVAQSTARDHLIRRAITEGVTEPDLFLNPLLVNESNLAPYIIQKRHLIESIIK